MSPSSRALCRLAAALLVCSGISAAAPARAQIFPITELEFGTVAVGQSSGSVSVAPTGGASCGPHTCLGGQSSASFLYRGAGSTTYSISFSTGDQLDRVGGGDSAPLHGLQATGGNTVSTGFFGFGFFSTGGSLLLDPTTLGGDYTGSYTVTVAFP